MAASASALTSLSATASKCLLLSFPGSLSFSFASHGRIAVRPHLCRAEEGAVGLDLGPGRGHHRGRPGGGARLPQPSPSPDPPSQPRGSTVAEAPTAAVARSVCLRSSPPSPEGEQGVVTPSASPRWDEFVRKIWPDRLIPDLRGIFLSKDQPIPLTPKLSTFKSGFVPSHPILVTKYYLSLYEGYRGTNIYCLSLQC
ncbi:hypothetical protein OsJ_28384 [Oryza sativa Japonica Group]|uniref:Uncharacterized protein n=1 Tax=Oryza sativa subsp. japonica TaxID=39947 RepID=A3BW26_ORYSJ|nr:hypothetical protein OsJ_28384 [Oryza sativa Japonica Group]